MPTRAWSSGYLINTESAQSARHPTRVTDAGYRMSDSTHIAAIAGVADPGPLLSFHFRRPALGLRS